MKKFIVASALALSLLVPGVAFAALTETQINAVLGLLRAFNADESALFDVEASLRGEVLGATVACPALTMTLQRGMSDAKTGGQVTKLQTFLAAYYGLNAQDTVTGYFGSVTQRTVIRFQTEQGLSPVGVVGVQTRAKIASVCSGGSVSTTPILKPGPICPAIAFIPMECAVGAPSPRYDANGCQTGWTCTPTATTTPPIGCKLEITKTVDREDYKSSGTATVTPNENLGYTIEFKNSGTTRCSVVKVQDVLDANLTYVSETHSTNVTAGYLSLPTYQSATRTVSFNAWDLDPSETGWVKIQTKTGTPNSCSVIVPNSAMITAYEYNNFITWVYSNTASVTLKKDCPLPPSSITVTAPNGGEQWEQGTMNTITWSPYSYNPDVNPSRDVKAYLEQKVGTSYVVVGTVLPSGKASIHWEGDIDTFGKYPAPGSYYIRVLNTVTGAWDRSDVPFTILPRSVNLKLNGSDGPISTSLNTPVTASWTSTGATSCQLHNAYDVPSAQATTSIIPVATSGQRQIYVGNLPSWSVTLVCTRTSDGRSVYDSVTVNVTNTESRVKVVSPNGGETIPLNQTFNILWERAGIKSASIALYRNDQWVKWLSQEVVSDNEPRMFAWTPSLDEAETIAPWRGSVYKIYITGQKSDGTGYVEDKSDAPFGFSGATQPPVPATLTLTSPQSGSVVTVGNPIPISWSFTNAPKNSQILLTVKNVQPSSPASGTSSGGSWQSTLIPTTNGTGSYSWTTGLGYLDYTGTYQVTAQLKQCDPNGCNYSYNLPLPVFATSNTVQFTVAPRPAGSIILNPNSSGPGSGVQDF